MVDGDTYTLGDLDTVSMSMFGCVENDNQCVVVFQAWYYSPSEHACLYPTMTSMQSVAPGCSGLYARAVTYCFQNGGGPVVNSWIINSWCNCLD